MFNRPEQQDKQTLKNRANARFANSLARDLLRFNPCTILVFALPLLMLGAVGSAQPVSAQAVGNNPSGLPIPRFVSLKAERINMRIGPGRQFKVVWLYQRRGLPMEVIQEYDNWRKVRDPEGDEGWILHSLLSGKRTVIVNPGEMENASVVTNMHSEPNSNSSIVATIQPGVVGEIKVCEEAWCEISVDGSLGFVSKTDLWGVYPNELIE